MYLVESKELMTQAQKQEFKTGGFQTFFFPKSFLDKADEADKYEMHGTNFNDPGPDFTLHLLIKNNRIIANIQVLGY